MTKSYLKALEFIHFRDFLTVTIWLNNCSGQNKCWAFFGVLVYFENMADIADTIKLKYFTTDHTFTSVNSFYQKVEKEMKDVKKVISLHVLNMLDRSTG